MPTTDTQLTAMGAAIKTALNVGLTGDTTANCREVYYSRNLHGLPRGKHPCLEIYRESENIERKGNAGQQVRTVEISLAYLMGPTSDEGRDEAFALLETRVPVIHDAIEDNGAAWYSSASIESVLVRSITYEDREPGGGEVGGWPTASFKIVMEHRYTRSASPAEGLTTIEGHVNLDNVAAGTFGHALDEFKVTV